MELKTLVTGSSGNSYLLKPKTGKSLIIDCVVNLKKVKGWSYINYQLRFSNFKEEKL